MPEAAVPTPRLRILRPEAYRGDALGRHVAAVLRRAGRPPQAELLESGGFTLRYTSYDWGLNGVDGPADAPRRDP